MTFAASGVPPSGSSTDEDLLAAAGRGDQSAIGQLYDRFSGQMYGLAMRITQDATLAQDVVQEAFVGIWRNAARFDASRASARTWIMSIAHNRAIDAIRRRAVPGRRAHALGAGAVAAGGGRPGGAPRTLAGARQDRDGGLPRGFARDRPHS